MGEGDKEERGVVLSRDVGSRLERDWLGSWGVATSGSRWGRTLRGTLLGLALGVGKEPAAG